MFFYTQNSFIAKAIILQLSIELLVTIVDSTLHKTTNPPVCSRPSHPNSRGYLGQVQQGDNYRFLVRQLQTIGIGWAER